jgi:cell wall-associated NlpC family hydrolase
VFYAGSNGVINHVAIYVGNGKVVSFGSEPGPLLLNVNYRTVAQTRRYL